MTVRPDIAHLLAQGLANHRIAQEVHTSPARVQAAREALGIPNLAYGSQGAASVDELFKARTEPLPGGHLKWKGAAGALKLRWRGRNYSAAAVAFRIRTDRDPVGRTRNSCGTHLCVAPAHVSDQAERDRDNALFNALIGGTR